MALLNVGSTYNTSLRWNPEDCSPYWLSLLGLYIPTLILSFLFRYNTPGIKISRPHFYIIYGITVNVWLTSSYNYVFNELCKYWRSVNIIAIRFKLRHFTDVEDVVYNRSTWNRVTLFLWNICFKYQFHSRSDKMGKKHAHVECIFWPQQSKQIFFLWTGHGIKSHRSSFFTSP